MRFYRVRIESFMFFSNRKQIDSNRKKKNTYADIAINAIIITISLCRSHREFTKETKVECTRKNKLISNNIIPSKNVIIF